MRDKYICLAPEVRENERRGALETHSLEIAVDDFAGVKVHQPINYAADLITFDREDDY